jgi:CheY-like chemotaxis protein/PAS domain-containing protein
MDFPMDYLATVRKNLVELKDMLEINKAEIRDRCSVLQDASDSLLTLSKAQDSNLRALYELPMILQSVLSNDAVGALILSAEGKVLLFNGAAQKIFGSRLLLDELQRFRCELFHSDSSLACSPSDLPWEKALGGEETKGARLYLPRSGAQGGSWLSIDAVPLWGRSREEVGGAVVLLVDITEPLQVEIRVKSVVSSLSQHIMTIECAQNELYKLAEKLGVDGALPESMTEMIQPYATEPGCDYPPTTIPAAEAAAVEVLKSPPPVKKPVPEAEDELYPAAAPAKAPQASLPKAGALEVQSEAAPQKKILIVDDLAVNQKLLQLDIDSLGYESELANHGQEAVDKISKSDFLLVFMDCDMPVMNGYEATAIVRQTEKGTGKHTPIVAMTAYDRHGDKERCYAIGMDHYLTKGVGLPEIEAVIDLCRRGELDGSKRFGQLRPQSSASDQAPSAEQESLTINMGLLIETYGKVEANEIVQMFSATSERILQLLDEAIRDHNSSVINHLAYSFKGPCAFLGLQALVRTTVDIASYAALGRWSAANESFQLLTRMYKRLQGEIKDFGTDKSGSAPLTPAAEVSNSNGKDRVDTLLETARKKNAALAANSLDAGTAPKVRTAPANAIAIETPFDTHQVKVLEKLEAVKAKVGRTGALNLIEAYYQDLTGVDERIRTAIKLKDVESMRSICHFLTGCYRSLNAREAAGVCREMGELAIEGNWDGAAYHSETLFSTIQSVSQALNRFRTKEESE